MQKKLGFGFMRLPLTDKQNQTSFDYDLLNKLVDVFIEKGFSYFDTALSYHKSKSEEAIRKSLVERYPRDAFQLATKLPPRVLHSEADCEKIFAQQLERCGVTYFDYYLVHNLGHTAYQQAQQYRVFEFVMRKKQAGAIGKVGFSFHDSPELLDEILTANPGLDFVQLQINYVDWESPAIQSRRCYEVARKHHMPVIVMEPCKGGNLAQLPDPAEKLMKAYNPNASIPSWAIRYAAGLDGVFMVLSGMAAMEHVMDNTSFMTNFETLNQAEHQVIGKVVDIINESVAVPCTMCRYCEDTCPKNIPIPDCFALYNGSRRATTDNNTSQLAYYLNLTATRGKACDCLGCKRCESVCPQHLVITKHLQEVSSLFDGKSLPATFKN